MRDPETMVAQVKKAFPKGQEPPGARGGRGDSRGGYGGRGDSRGYGGDSRMMQQMYHMMQMYQVGCFLRAWVCFLGGEFDQR